MKLIRRIWRLLDERQQRRLWVLQLASLAMALSTVISITAIVPFFATLADPQAIERSVLLGTLYKRLHFTSDSSFIVSLGVGFFFLVLAANTINLLGSLAVNRFAFDVGNTFFVRLFDTYLRRGRAFHSRNNGTVLASKVLHEAARVSSGIVHQGLILVSNAVTILFLVTCVLILNPVAAAGAVLVLGTCYVAVYASTRGRLLLNGRNESRHFAERSKVLAETFAAVREITLLQAGAYFVQRFTEQCRAMAQLELSTLAISLSPRRVLECATVFCLVGMALYLRIGVTGADAWLGQLGFVGLAAYRLLPALQQVFLSLARVRSSLPALDHIEVDLLPQSLPEAVPSGRSIHPRRDIRLQGVSFRYDPDHRLALANVSLVIPAGSAVGLIGANGSGKTTLVDILAGLLPPQAGRLLVDDTPLGEDDMPAWQAGIAYVPQQVFIFDATIAENIAVGVPYAQIDQRRLDEVIAMAGFAECVRAFPRGLQDTLGEQGCRLSGGQRQRLGIARALYRDASVLILDEATSSLDRQAEEAVVNMLERLRPTQTLITIAHRMSALRHCDVIYELDEGRIVSNLSGALHPAAHTRSVSVS